MHPDVVDQAVAGAASPAPGRRGIIARGLGRSYGDAAQNAGGSVLDATWLDAIHEVDLVSGQVTVGAGVSLQTLMERLVPLGWFVPVTPGHPTGHRRRGHRRRHPRQEPPRGRQLLLPRPRDDVGHPDRDRHPVGLVRSCSLLGHRRGHGPDRRGHHGHAPDDPHRDQLHAGGHRAGRRPRRRHGDVAHRGRRLPLLGGLDRLPVHREPSGPFRAHPRRPRPPRRPARTAAPGAGPGPGVRPPDAGPRPRDPAQRPAQPPHGGGLQRVLVPQGPRPPGGQAPPHDGVLPPPRRGGGMEPPLWPKGLPAVPVRRGRRARRDGADGHRTPLGAEAGQLPGCAEAVRARGSGTALLPHPRVDPGPRPAGRPSGAGPAARRPRPAGGGRRWTGVSGQGLAGLPEHLPGHVPPSRRVAGGAGPRRPRGSPAVRSRAASRAVHRCRGDGWGRRPGSRGPDPADVPLPVPSLQGRGLQGRGLQGRGLQGRGLQGGGLQGRGLEGTDLQGADLQGADGRGGPAGPARRQGLGARDPPGQVRQAEGSPDQTPPNRSARTTSDGADPPPERTGS